MKAMIQRCASWIRRHWAISLLAGVATATAAGVWGPRLIETSESPEFCARCHANQNEDWLHSAHRSVRCIDCHLPNENLVSHYLWKGIDGGKDVFLHVTGLGDANDTALTGHGRKVLQANCVRCHADMVARIDTTRSCVDCHRVNRHRRTALIHPREETSP